MQREHEARNLLERDQRHAEAARGAPFAEARFQSEAEYISNHSHRDPVAGQAVTPVKVPEGRTNHAGWGSHTSHCSNTASSPLAGFRQNEWPESPRMGGRIHPECVAGFNRNGWPDSTRMGGRFAP